MVISFRFVLILVLFFSSFTLHSQNLRIEFTNIRSSKGQLLIAIFESQQNFDAQKPTYSKKVKKSGIENGKLSVEIPVEPGNYGVSVIDDENNNSDIDTNFFGIPVEGFGFSNITRILFGKPKFKDFSFNVNKDTNKTENIFLRYFF